MSLNLLKQKSNVEGSQTHIYYDINITNQSQTNESVPLTFNEIRSQPILYNPSEYFLSVVRFSVDTPSISVPAFIPQVQLNQYDVQKLIYKITIAYSAGGTITNQVSNYMHFLGDNTSVNMPTAPTTFATLSDPYYFLENYSSFIANINVEIGILFNQLKVLQPLATAKEAAPWLEYDPATGLCSLYASQGFCYDINNRNQVPKFVIYFNKPLHTLFSSFEYQYFGNTYNDGKDYSLMPRNLYYNTQPNPASGTLPVMYKTIQQYPSLNTAGNPVQSIVFQSTLLPVNGNLSAIPQVYGVNPANGTIPTTNSNFINMLTDLQVQDGNYKPKITYIPQSEYRLIDLTSNSPLSNVDITVFWTDVYGVLHPILLDPQCSATLKLLFRRKNYNLTNWV